MRAPALVMLVGLLVGCDMPDMLKEKLDGNKDLKALSTQLTSELSTDVGTKLPKDTDLELTLKDVGPGGSQRDFARSVAEFARVYYAKPEKLQRITVKITDSAGKNPAPFTWTIAELAQEIAAAEKARADAARADSVAKAVPVVPAGKTKGAPPRTKAPAKPPVTKAPATKTPS